MTLERPPAISATAPTQDATQPTPLEDAISLHNDRGCDDAIVHRIKACLRERFRIEDDMDIHVSGCGSPQHVFFQVSHQGQLVWRDYADLGPRLDMTGEGSLDLTGGDTDIFGRGDDCGDAYGADGEDFVWPEDEGHSPEEALARSRGYVPPEEYVEQRSAAVAAALQNLYGRASPGMPVAA